MKEILEQGCQDFVNSYYGAHGKVNFNYFDRFLKFRFGIDEGFYGVKDNEIHIMIQGSDEDLEWRGDVKSNFNFWHKRILKLSGEHAGKNDKVKVHPGFYEAFLTGKDYFLSLCKGYDKIFVKGHSRGAGIGTLIARDIQHHVKRIWKTNQKVYLITGGSPRVYNAYGAEDFDDCGIISYRLKYRNDIVSNVPWPIMGYRHVGKLITLGKPYIPSPIGIPWDHYPEKYLQGIKEYKGKL